MRTSIYIVSLFPLIATASTFLLGTLMINALGKPISVV
jgi:hypothetical protein